MIWTRIWAAHFNMPRDHRAGLSVYWAQYGTAPDTLLIHCSLAHQGAWAPLVAKAGLNAIAFDMPGHGRSAKWDGVTDYQAQTTSIAHSFCDAPMHVMGHSFGATVALRLALEHPASLRSLTLIEPVFFAAAQGTPEHAAHEVAFAPFVAAMEAEDRPRAARLFTDIWGTGAPWESLPDSQQRALTDRIHLILAGAPAINEDNAGQLTPGRLEALETPTLLLRGSRSNPVTAAINATLARRLPNATSHTINGVGHMGPLTHAAVFAAHINRFQAHITTAV